MGPFYILSSLYKIDTVESIRATYFYFVYSIYIVQNGYD